MSDRVILTDHLTRHFGSHVAVDQLTIAIQSGEVFGFLGHNGAGKTTTIRLLNGVLPSTGGAARVLDMDPKTEGAKIRRHTGVLTETPALDDRLTARANLRFYADVYGVPEGEVDRRVELLLISFGLLDRADDKIGSFSKGMRQRMALARTLVHNPQILFLDEPTSGLDPLAAREVYLLIERLSRDEGRTIFLCTHNLVEAQRLCDRVAVLAHGRLLALGAPSELAQRYGGSHRLQLSVEPSQIPETLAIIDAFQGAEAASLQNGESGIIEVVGVDRTATPFLIGALTGAGIALYSVVPHEPSLEEVYLALQANG
jgi:ABC-2 type transport system ATP-binding protein